MSTPIEEESQLEAYIADEQPGWLIKHSNACGISSAAFEQYQQHCQANPEQRAAHIIIQTHRPLSNRTAEILGRVHQSPQLFLLQGGQVLWAATHWSITAEAMAAAWAEQVS
ncbi:MAG: bacillithiol system redox-active protein YtxJ [Planctomycetota bacterium]|nr:MAG: bacillithiol system redox-active protein YtxJ [Planctomycetota bacterium]